MGKVKTWVLHFGWSLWGELTLAVSLVHDLQVRVSHAARHQQRALILVRLPVTAAHGVLAGDVGAVWGAHALGPPRLHFANLPRAAFDSLARVWKSRAGVSVGGVLPCEHACRHQVIRQAFSHKTSCRSGVGGASPQTVTHVSPDTIFTFTTSLY